MDRKKIMLSEAIGLHLKEFRMQYHIKAKDIALFLNKSPAYISKLEKGQIQQIDKDTLSNITDFITGSDNGYMLFCEKIAEHADSKELERNVMLLNFDLVDRRLPVTEELVSFFKTKMDNLKVSSHELAKYINQNEDLGADFFQEHGILFNSIEKNTWYSYREADTLEQHRNFIYLNYDSKRIDSFIDGKIFKCEYMFPFSMLYHLLKMTYKQKGKAYDDKLIDKCHIEAEKLLFEHKFYSLSVRSRLRHQAESANDFNQLLSSFDLDNQQYTSLLFENIRFLSEFDIDYTNQKLKKIVENFTDCDASFALAYMSISLSQLADLQVSLKRDFLQEIESIVSKYSNLIHENENIEKY